MSPKNETLTLLVTLAIASAILVGMGGWLRSRFSQWDSRSALDRRSPSKNFADVRDVPDGLFNYGGSTTWAPIRGKVDPAIALVRPDFRLVYTEPTSGTPGTGSGIRMMIENQLSFSQASRSLKDSEIARARERGLSLKEIPVAIDAIAIAVHPELKVPGITIARLKDIYTGKITNWNQVGGPNLKIVPYSRHREDGGTVEFFVEQVLQKADFGRNVKYVYSTTRGLREVARNVGGIYFASAPEVIPQCRVKALPLGKKEGKFIAPYRGSLVPPRQCPGQRNQLNEPAFKRGEYPLTRRLFVIIKRDGQSDEQAGEAYAALLLTSQGQELIEEAGFVPVH